MSGFTKRSGTHKAFSAIVLDQDPAGEKHFGRTSQCRMTACAALRTAALAAAGSLSLAVDFRIPDTNNQHPPNNPFLALHDLVAVPNFNMFLGFMAW